MTIYNIKQASKNSEADSNNQQGRNLKRKNRCFNFVDFWYS